MFRSSGQVVNVQDSWIGALLRTLVTTDLDRTLEVNLHRIRELECLEVSIRQHRRACPEVLDLRKPRHQLRSRHTSTLIHQLNRSSLTIVSHAVSHQHIKLAVVVLDGQHHRHRLADLYQSGHLRSPWSLSDLNLHPASHIISSKVRSNHVQHIHGERPERYALLVLIVPRASQLPGLIPNLLHLRIVLQYNYVLEVRSRSRFRSRIPIVQSIISISGCSTLINPNVESSRTLAQPGRQVDAVDVAVVALREYDTEEGLIELNEHLHALLFTFHVQ